MIEKPPYKPQPVKYIAYKELDAVDTAVLIKPSAFNRLSIERYYFRGVVDTSRIIVASLEYGADNKVNNKIMEPVMEQLLTELNSLGVKVIYVADAKYFNYITKLKVTNCIGTIVPCKLKGFEHFKVIAGINYQALVHQPTQASLLDISVNTLHQHLEGFDVAKAKDIIKDALYITNPKQYSIIESQLYKLLHEPKLAVDIECAGDEDKDALRFNKSELTSIAFATNDSDGIAIYIDNDKKIKAMLKKFFIDFTHKTIYHNGLFDIKTLIYHLFMEDSSDIEGMFYGIDVMTRNIEDTQVLTYLCTNNVQENKLGLKHNVLEYTGQYAEDVSDVKKLSVDDLLTYNLKDTLATFWLWQKRNYELDIENQRDIYENLFMPSFKALLESMLVGLPMDMNVIDKVKEKLEAELVKVEQIFTDSKIIQEFNQELQTQAMIKANAKLKTKVKLISDFKHILFNPGSALQKVQLLYTKFSLPVLDYTKKKQPAVGKKTLDKLLFHVKDPEIKQIIEALVDYADITKILSTFIGAFEKFAFTRNDGTVWLNGAQILCGTVSGRLASREPNLANLPSNSKYGKLIKSCFVAPKGWLFAGADFSALG